VEEKEEGRTDGCGKKREKIGGKRHRRSVSLSSLRGVAGQGAQRSPSGMGEKNGR